MKALLVLAALVLAGCSGNKKHDTFLVKCTEGDLIRQVVTITRPVENHGIFEVTNIIDPIELKSMSSSYPCVVLEPSDDIVTNLNDGALAPDKE